MYGTYIIRVCKTVGFDLIGCDKRLDLNFRRRKKGDRIENAVETK